MVICDLVKPGVLINYVNLKHITAFTANDVEIGKLEIPIGDTYKALVQQIKKT